MSTAHIVVFIDTTQSPPVVIGGGIYSEKSPTSDLRRALPLEYMRIHGDTYADAEEHAKRWLVDGGAAAEWLRKLPGLGG